MAKKKRESYPYTLDKIIREYEEAKREPWGMVELSKRDREAFERRIPGRSWVDAGRLQEGEMG